MPYKFRTISILQWAGKKLKLRIWSSRWKEEKEMEVESLEKRDTGLDSRRLQKVKRQISRTRQRSSIRGRKSSRNTMTREQANRRGSVSLSSIPARSLSPRGIPPEGGWGEEDFFWPLADSASDKVSRGAGAERVTRPFVNNLVKVANCSGLFPPPVFVEGATGIRQKTHRSATGHSNACL